LTRQSPITISFVVPALNEEKVVESVVTQILGVVEGRFSDYEIILIDDGSTDATAAIMDRLAENNSKMQVLRNKGNIGLGASYQRGLQEARFDYLMLLCGDGGLPASGLPPIFEQIGNADIVIPYMLNMRGLKTPFRYFLSRTYTNLLNTLFGFRLRYYNGLPVHRTALLRSIHITSEGFGFQGEILVKLLKSGCTYVEVGTLGAEETRRSFALRPQNVLSVTRTLLHLILEIVRFDPVPQEVIERSRQPARL
jgi:glycosyltransferase involved in cell wall biosynthesis